MCFFFLKSKQDTTDGCRAPPPTACSFVRGPSGDAVPWTFLRANHLLIAGTEAWTSQADVELAASGASCGTEAGCGVAISVGWRLFLVSHGSFRSHLFLTGHRLLLLVTPSIASGCLIGLDLFHASLLPQETCQCTSSPGQQDAHDLHAFGQAGLGNSVDDRLGHHLGQNVLKVTLPAPHAANVQRLIPRCRSRGTKTKWAFVISALTRSQNNAEVCFGAITEIMRKCSPPLRPKMASSTVIKRVFSRQ